MELTRRTAGFGEPKRQPSLEERRRQQATAEVAWQVRISLAAIRERLRVARLRAADRQRLADNAGAAGQEAFELPLRDAADAHLATARALEDAMLHLERCWSHIEDQRRVRQRTAMRLRGARHAEVGVDLQWRDDD